MQTLEAIARQAATLQRILGVVRTMKTLSAVNAAPYDAAVQSIDSYYETVRQALHVVLRDIDMNALRAPERERRSILLVFGSDHGMCGGFNEDTAALAVQRIGGAAPPEHVLAVGARCEMALEAADAAAERTFLPPASAEGAGRLANDILLALDGYRHAAGEVAVDVIYNRRGADESHETLAERLLPLDRHLLDEVRHLPWPKGSVPAYSMEPAALFASLLHQYLFVRLFRIASLSMAAENAARLAQMQQAEKSIEERLEGLTMAHRTARQTQITDELLDVIGGFEALSSSGGPAPNGHA